MNLRSRLLSRLILLTLPHLQAEAQIRVLKKLQITTLLNSDLAQVQVLCHSYHELKHRPNAIEPETENWVRHYVQNGEVLFDIGASVGPYALLAAKRYPSLTAYAFEPSFANFHSLCRNILLNSLEERVYPVCAALADRTYVERFTMAHTAPGPAGHHLQSTRENNPTLSQKETRFTSLVAIYSLDDFLAQMAAPFQVHHLKIDVDGLDLLVLRGAGHTLANQPVRSICVEVNEDNMSPIVDFLKHYNFVVTDNPMGPREVWNIVFTR